MSNLMRFFRKLKFKRSAKIVKLDTGITSVYIPTTSAIKRIEVFDSKIIDSKGVTLKLIK